MNNIWKYSLVLAFSIIIDQLIKGTAQSLLLEPTSIMPIVSLFNFVRAENHGVIFGIEPSFMRNYQNTICHLLDLALMVWVLKKIIYFRNKSPLLGWGYNLWLVGLFTSWLDRVTLGYTLDYLSIGKRLIVFSLGDLFTALGVLMVITLEYKFKTQVKL